MKYLIFLFAFLFSTSVFAQSDSYQKINSELTALSVSVPGLLEKVQVSVTGVNIEEFIRSISIANSVNVSVDQLPDIKVTNNFFDVNLKDVFVLLCRQYDLDIVVTGTIITFRKPVPVANPVYMPKNIVYSWNAPNHLLTLDLNKDSILLVSKKLTQITGQNIIVSPELAGKMVSGYVQSLPLKVALEKIALTNGLKVTMGTDSSFFFETRSAQDELQLKPEQKRKSPNPAASGVFVKSYGSMVDVDANAAPLADIIAAVCTELNINYFLLSELKGSATLNISGLSFEGLLNYLFNGTDYTFNKQGEIYLIGDRNQEGLRNTQVVQLNFRTVEKITDFIPADLKKNVELKIFPELNSLILCGSLPRINEIVNFIRLIDKVVPVILFDVIIVDVSDTKTLITSLKAGIENAPTTTKGTIYPGVSMELGAGSVNDVLSRLGTMGSVNLGRVMPNVYVHLQALERQGLVKIHSTPQLTTLNGHEATLSVGETQYYFEQNSTILGTQNVAVNNAGHFIPLKADLSIKINPLVSGDEQITLDISVKKSSFGARFAPNAPPSSIDREFKSMIRVRNEETIILGGLEEQQMSETAEGVPFLSRIPVIKWLFSSRNREKIKKKLTILIKPTVIY